MPLFEESRRRIDRAHGHAAAFISDWRDILESDSYRFDAKMQDERTGIVRGTLIVPLRNEPALELGEFFYQLRAALDGAVYRVVDLKRGPEQIAKINRLEFPICEDVPRFKDSAFHKNPFPDDLGLWLEEVQPYNAAKTADKEYRGINAALQLLHDCARKDRHRQLHIVAAVPGTATGTIQIDPPGRITYLRMLRTNLLEDKGEFLQFGIEGAVPGMNIHLNGKFRVQVSIEEIPGIVNKGIIKVLSQLEGATTYAIDRFEKSFA